MPGAVVPTPDGGTQKIKKTKLRGEITEAMMCSPLEIGVSENHDSIHVLDESLANHIGEDINLYLNK